MLASVIGELAYRPRAVAAGAEESNMSELDAQCLEAFPVWLQRLPEDTRAFSLIACSTALPDVWRAKAAGALNHVVKSLDLIPEGIEDLGFIDDAFVLRGAARHLAAQLSDEERASVQANEESELARALEAVSRLAAEAALVERFLGADAARLARYVDSLEQIVARGRSAARLVSEPDLCAEVCAEVASWAEKYRAPSFTRDLKNLVKVRAFMTVKLPA
jgi:uncharacterized membrane protein YkvA (DUF1232 family)